MNPQGRILLLNGTSSSGKSSLARALQAVLSTRTEPWFHFSGDTLRATHPTHTPLTPASMPRFLEAIPHSLAVYAAYGSNLIVDDIFGGAQVLNYAHAFAPFSALFVGVRCPLPVLKAREIARGDRKPGTAAELNSWCHAHNTYDLQIDTSTVTPEEAAQTIKARLEHGPAPDALRRIAQGTPTL